MQHEDLPAPRLRVTAIVGALALLAGLGVALVYGPAWMPWPTLPDMTPEPLRPEVIQLPDEFQTPVPVVPKPGTPAVVPQPGPLRVDTPLDTPVARQGLLDAINPFAMTPAQPTAVPISSESPGKTATGTPGTQLAIPTSRSVQTQVSAVQVHHPPPQTAEKAVKKPWAMLVETKETPRARTTPLPEERSEARQAPRGADLIQPATWAKPANPLLTLYRSQTLYGRLEQDVNTDIPGQLKILLIMPVFDKFAGEVILLDKDTIVIAKVQERPQYGAKRINLTLEQIELPTGEVISVKAQIGDEAGANGIPGKVNNHYGKLLLATGISAILNIGTQAATGTPSGFYSSPSQQAARDIGSSVQRDASGIVDRELRLPPTIVARAGTFCSINLQENIHFQRPPYVAR